MNQMVKDIFIANIFIGFLFSLGCVGLRYSLIHPHSELMQPTFCLNFDPDFQRPCEIRTIAVHKWVLEYPDSGLRQLTDWVFRRHRPKPVSCITYGHVPPGYRENMPALPLEPNRIYVVHITGGGNRGRSEPIRFAIRSNDAGMPMKLEYGSEGGSFDEMKVKVISRKSTE